MYPIDKNKTWATCLGHHATPRHKLGINLGSRLLLVSHDGLEQAVEMLIARVIMFVKCVETLAQIRPQAWRIVPLHGPIVQVKFMLVIVREASKFLDRWVSKMSPLGCGSRLTRGRFTLAQSPEKRPIGCISKELLPLMVHVVRSV